MFRPLKIFESVIALLCATQSTFASPNASTSGTCSPVAQLVEGAITFNLNCPVTNRIQIQYQLSESSFATIRDYYALSEVAVQNLFQLLNSENVPPYQLPKRLKELVTEVKELRSKLLAQSSSARNKELFRQAIQALDSFDLSRAIVLHKQILESDTLQQANAILLERAEVQHSLGDLFVLQHRYSEAAEQFREMLSYLLPMNVVQIARAKVSWINAADLAGHQVEKSFLTQIEDAILSSEKLGSAGQHLLIQALAVKLRVLVDHSQAEPALKLFHERIRPLLNSETSASRWALLCFGCIGAALLDQGKPEAARSILEAGLDLGKQQLTPDPSAIVVLQLNLSVVFDELGNSEEAAKHGRLAREILLRSFPGEDHPDFVSIYIANAVLAKEHTEKERLYFRSFEIAARIWLPVHPLYQKSLKNALGEKGLNVGRMIYGPESAAVIVAAQFKPSREYLERLYSLHLEKVSEVTADLDSLAERLIEFPNRLLENEFLEEAGVYYKKIISLYEDKGADGIPKGYACFNFGNILTSPGLEEPAAAEKYIRCGLDTYAQRAGMLNEYTRFARRRLVGFLLAKGRAADAAQVVGTFENSYKGRMPAEARAHAEELKRALPRTGRKSVSK